MSILMKLLKCVIVQAETSQISLYFKLHNGSDPHVVFYPLQVYKDSTVRQGKGWLSFFWESYENYRFIVLLFVYLFAFI